MQETYYFSHVQTNVCNYTLDIYYILVTMNGITIFFQFNTRHIKDNDTVSSFKLPCKGFLYHNNKIIDNPISIIHFVY